MMNYSQLGQVTPEMYRNQAIEMERSKGTSIGSSIGSVVGGAVSAFTGIPGLSAAGGLLGSAAGGLLSNQGGAYADANTEYNNMIESYNKKYSQDLSQKITGAQRDAYQNRMQSMRRNVIPNSIDYLKFV